MQTRPQKDRIYLIGVLNWDSACCSTESLELRRGGGVLTAASVGREDQPTAPREGLTRHNWGGGNNGYVGFLFSTPSTAYGVDDVSLRFSGLGFRFSISWRVSLLIDHVPSMSVCKPKHCTGSPVSSTNHVGTH